MTRDQKTTISIKGPAFQHKQISLNRHAAPTYSQRIYIFSLSEPEPVDAVVSTLQSALQAGVDCVPFLAGLEVHGVPGSTNKRYIHNEDGTGALELVVNDLRDRKDLAYETLSHAGFPQGAFVSDELFPIQGFGTWPEVSPAAFFQANFVKGGLLLGVCISHVAMDGVSISNFVGMLGSMCRDIQDGRAPTSTYSKEAFSNGVFEDMAAATVNGDDTKKIDVGEVLSRHDGYMHNPTGLATPPPGSPWLLANVAKMLFISADSVKALVGEVRQVYPSVSKHDAVVSLLWRAVVKASKSLGRLQGSVAEVTMPVNVRRFEDLRLAPDFIGNGYYLTRCELPLMEMLGDQGVPKAAAALRKLISGLSGEKIREFFGVYEYLGDSAWVWTMLPSMVGLVYARSAGFFMTSHYYHDLDKLDFGPLLGRVTSFRLPKEGVGGITTVLPRASERLKEGFELSMEWDEPMWEKLAKDELLNKYVTIVD